MYDAPNFSKFAAQVAQRFAQMSKQELFCVDIAGDALWELYLATFPEGTNPVFRTRTEYDCSCCKNFIRNIGNVVTVVGGELQSVWSLEGLEFPFNIVANALAHTVEDTGEVVKLFRTKEPGYGAEATREELEDGSVRRWNHFYATISSTHRSNTPDQVRGDFATSVQVFKRGLEELTPDSFETVIDLIGDKALYRGEEFLKGLKEFRTLQKKYLKLSDKEKNLFVWQNANNPACRFRNTAMGTLIQDLSAGMELEAAVRSFESKVAPTNYKRPTALITKKMIEDAMKTIKSLDLESTLERRFAKIGDVSVNNVLWADGSVRGKMKDGIEGLLLGAVKEKVSKVDKAELIIIDDFMENVLPKSQSMEVLVKNSMMGRFMSITAPVHESTGKLFKWNNDFAWSYDGDITDSIKERVKKAGGSVTGDLCCRLAWDYTDDLDFHMYEPGGDHLYFAHRHSRCGGKLDVDANGGNGMMDEPVENIFYQNRDTMKKGIYTLKVENFNRRSSNGSGFIVEIEFGGQAFTFNYDKTLRDGGTIEVAQVEYTGSEFQILKSLPSTQTPRQKWGISTESFVKVDTFMLSPNHWDENSVGNKHYFFILEGCKNPDGVRGIYNEFLNSDLDKHRKVFEVLGSKTKCEPSDEQLSGVGFSSTQKDSVVVRVQGQKINKLYEINF